MQRTWTLRDDMAGSDADISQRGLCLMHIEFLVKNPSSECILTSASIPFANSLMDMFPKTLFHVFCANLEDQPRPNVIRHWAIFDKGMAAAWRDRGTAPFSIIFTGEGMDNQMALYVTASPAAALLTITSPPEHYLEGDLMCPLYCPANSCISGLVPSGSKAVQYGGAAYLVGIRAFHSELRGAGSTYDADAETEILAAYTRTIVRDELTSMLMVEVVRAGLPSATETLRFSGHGARA